jgi:Fe-S cluster biogenesis protein NfuA
MDDLRRRVAHVEELAHQIEAESDPETWSRVRELVRCLMDVHAEGLERLLGRIADRGEAGAAIIDDLAADASIGSLLLLHDLHPSPLETRVRRALEDVRPALATHGGNVEFVGLNDRGVVRLRLEGSCHGCPSSAATLKSTIEEAVYAAAPDVSGIEVDGSGLVAPEEAR